MLVSLWHKMVFGVSKQLFKYNMMNYICINLRMLFNAIIHLILRKYVQIRWKMLLNTRLKDIVVFCLNSFKKCVFYTAETYASNKSFWFLPPPRDHTSLFFCSPLCGTCLLVESKRPLGWLLRPPGIQRMRRPDEPDDLFDNLPLLKNLLRDEDISSVVDIYSWLILKCSFVFFERKWNIITVSMYYIN